VKRKTAYGDDHTHILVICPRDKREKNLSPDPCLLLAEGCPEVHKMGGERFMNVVKACGVGLPELWLESELR
jgi:hypothetical protein